MISRNLILLSLVVGSFYSTILQSKENEFTCTHHRYKNALRSVANSKLAHFSGHKGIIESLEKNRINPKLKSLPQEKIDFLLNHFNNLRIDLDGKIIPPTYADITDLAKVSIKPTSEKENEAVYAAIFKTQMDMKIINLHIGAINKEEERLVNLAMKNNDPAGAIAVNMARDLTMSKLYEDLNSSREDEYLLLLKACAVAVNQESHGTQDKLIDNLKGKICIDTEKINERKSFEFVKTASDSISSAYPLVLVDSNASREALTECQHSKYFDCREVFIDCTKSKFFGISGLYGTNSRSCTSIVIGHESALKMKVDSKQCVEMKAVAQSLSLKLGNESNNAVLDSKREAKPQVDSSIKTKEESSSTVSK